MLKWSDELIIGVPNLDNQHKKILTHLNKLLKLVDLGFSLSDIKLAMERLEDIVNVHNDAEERLMKKYRYPYLKQHVKEHRIYSDNIKIISKALISHGSNIKLNGTIRSQVEDWYSSHLVAHDMKLGEFLRKLNQK